MYPTLIDLSGYTLHSYPFMLSVAFVTATLLASRAADKRGIDLSPDIGIWLFIGAILGAKIFFILQYNPFSESLGDVWHRHVWRAVFLWQGGLGRRAQRGPGLARSQNCCRTIE